MRKLSILILLLLTAQISIAQQKLQGMLMNEAGQPLKYVTVSLLQPSDSTLAFFGISNASGVVEIRDAKNGDYLLQAAILGYQTYYKQVSIPVSNGDLGTMILESQSVEMDGVEIVAEKIPMLINKDTIDYNASAFKTKPDASVEELLKKLPGVQVDRSGNIKAQGETVNKVFVDGKEFFGNDPKIATRNLPADAISKVQVFDKKSDAAEFTGIDDGTREKSINLKLKEDKKNGYFGDVTVGGGTDERYKASAKLYKFTDKSQLGMLGMFNNINRSGFSFSDYLNFSGGLQSLMSGGGGRFEIGNANQLPIDFGQPVTGIVTSGAGGINYNYEPVRNKRISVSYLGNGADKNVIEETYSQNFTTVQDYTTNSERNDNTREYAHMLSLNIRNDIDSQRQVLLNTKADMSKNSFSSNGSSISSVRDMIFNTQNNTRQNMGNSIGGSGGLSFTNTSKSRDDVLRVSAKGTYKRTLDEQEWSNITNFIGRGASLVNDQFRNDRIYDYSYGGSASFTHALSPLYYLGADVVVNNNVQDISRRQGFPGNEVSYIDTLSPDYTVSYTSVKPGFTFRKATKQIQYSIAARYEYGMLSQQNSSVQFSARNYHYILPSANWRNQYSKGKRVNLSYRTAINAPTYSELMPAPVTTSPLSVYYGNSTLNPEYSHNAEAGWMIYDQFTFSSFYASLSGRYTSNKISRSVYIDNASLSQTSTVVNVPDDYNAGLNLQYSRPIRKLGIKGEVSFSEDYDRGITLINGVQNITTGYTHDFTLKLGNRKKEKWDIEVGGGITLTDVRYSIQQTMNNVYYNTSGFTEISYRPNDSWYFMAAADVTRYDSRSFQQSVTIPLVRSEISYYFLKANKGVLTLEGFDLLNQNKGLQRISRQNYLAENRTNIIGQYFMLSFKYRINSVGKAQSGMLLDDIDINIR